MAFKKIPRETIEKVQDMRSAGMSHDDISTRLGISKNSAIKYSRDVLPATEAEIKNSIEGDDMGKPRFSVDKLISRAAEEAVESVIEKRLEPDDSIPFETAPPTAIESFFGDNGEPSAIKVYKLINGGVRFLSEIEPDIFKGWEDFETGFRHYVQERTIESRNSIWGDGVYQVKFRDKVRRIELGALVMPEQKMMTTKPSSVSEKMGEVVSIVEAVRKITPNNDSGNVYQVLYENQREELRILREELKALREKETDIASEINKAISLTKLVKGGGDSSPWLEAFKYFGPDLIGAVKDIAGALAASRNMPSSAPHLALKSNPPAPILPVQFQPLFDELHRYILTNDSSKFPEISRKLTAVFGGSDDILKGLAVSEITVEKACDLLTGYYQPFKDIQGQLSSYMTAYVGYLRTSPYKNFYEENMKKIQPISSTQPQVQPSHYSDTTPTSMPNSMLIVRCTNVNCGAVFDVPKGDWVDDDKVCGATLLDGSECQGRLEEVKKT